MLLVAKLSLQSWFATAEICEHLSKVEIKQISIEPPDVYQYKHFL